MDSATADDTSTTPRAKKLPLQPPIGGADAEPVLVPARMVNEILYCERLFYLEWIQGEWDSNRFTAEGDRVHKRVDAGKRQLAAPEESPEARPYQAKSVWLSSERLGLTAKLDVVDVDGGKAMAVEYKRGKRPKLPEGAYLPERAQLCAHVLLLREHGYTCDEAEIYFAGDHQRTRIDISDELVATTLGAIARANELAAKQELPPPLENSPKCAGCSLNTICLPDEVNYLRPKRLPLKTDADPSPAPRPLAPPKSAGVPLYVSTQGASVRLDGQRLSVYADGELQTEARLPNTTHVALFGNVQISTQAIRALLGKGVAVHFFSYGSWWSGAATGADSNNVELRLAQYRGTQDTAQCVALATRWVHSKIKNCRTLLRRNHRAADPVVLNELKFLANKALATTELESLLGIEGTAARTYFQSFGGMLSDTTLERGFDLNGRNRRPPKDRVNALLSLAYSLLTKDLVAACRAAGLDPLLGFYHQPHFGRPSLALDLMEEFRPLIADSVVLGALNNGVVQYDDFTEQVGSVALSDRGRKRFIEVYEQRLSDEITHQVFGYKVSYRRTLEVQARLLGRVLLGELPEYPIFGTR